VLQRVYKYGGQPFVRDYLAKNHGSVFDNTFGPKTGKAMMHSFAGRSDTQFSEHELAETNMIVQLNRHWRDCPPSTRCP
jgi:hypothetical protein